MIPTHTTEGSSDQRQLNKQAPDIQKSGPETPFFPRANIQPKLSINTPGDQYEQEADSMADHVMRMIIPGPLKKQSFFSPSVSSIHRKVHQPEDELDKEILHRKTVPGLSVQRKCAACEEEAHVHRKESREDTPSPDASLDSYVSSLGSSGHPLSESSRQFFEPRFGQDFSHVRIHTDTVAAKSADSINALAYATGNNIVFNQGQFSPESDNGKKLLAHELTHVVQQQSGIGRVMIQRSPGSPAGGCGLCYGNTADVGTAAHAIIERAFKARYPHLQTEFPVLGSPGDDNGKLDLADLDGPEHMSVGEIKPANATGLIQGDLDLLWYEDQLHFLGMSTSRMILPPPFVTLPFPTRAPPGCPQTQELFIDPPVNGVYTYYCEPDYSSLIIECDCRNGRRVRVPVPVAVPRTTVERIRDFVRNVIDTGGDVEAAARAFLQANPDLVSTIQATAIAAIIGLVVGMLAEDIASLGTAIVNNPLVVAAITALYRVAQMASQLSGLPQ